MHGGQRCLQVLDGRPKGKRPLGRPRYRWEGNIKMDLREIGINEANWIWLDQNRVQWWASVSMVMNLGFHKESRLLFDKLSDLSAFQRISYTMMEGGRKKVMVNYILYFQ
jgi:hypothetical protein